LKQEQPDRYFAIHAFLAKRNLELALEVSGSDRARYLREHLYHLVNDRNSSEQSLLGVVEIVNQQAPDVFVSFAEEFAQDDELKEALGPRLPTIEATMHKYQEETHPDREGEE
jgi:chlorite dismutase